MSFMGTIVETDTHVTEQMWCQMLRRTPVSFFFVGVCSPHSANISSIKHVTVECCLWGSHSVFQLRITLVQCLKCCRRLFLSANILMDVRLRVRLYSAVSLATPLYSLVSNISPVCWCDVKAFTAAADDGEQLFQVQFTRSDKWKPWSLELQLGVLTTSIA